MIREMVASQLVFFLQFALKSFECFSMCSNFQWIMILEHPEVISWLNIITIEKLLNGSSSSLRVVRWWSSLKETLNTCCIIETSNSRWVISRLLWIFRVVKIALQVIFQLGTKSSSVFLNKFAWDKWEIVIFISPLSSLDKVLFILVFGLNLSIVINEIAINRFLTCNLPAILQIVKLSNVIQEFHFLFFLHCMLLLLLAHFIAHLSEMLLHDSVACQFVLIINPFSKPYNIRGINKTFIPRVAHFSDSFEFWVISLRIWVCHMVAECFRRSITSSSCFCNRWSEYR